MTGVGQSWGWHEGMREIGPEKENEPRNRDRKIGGKFSENSVSPRALCYLPNSVSLVQWHQSSHLFTYLSLSRQCRGSPGQQRVCCQIFLKSTLRDWGVWTQMFCFPPAHPSLNDAFLKLNAPCETRKTNQCCRCAKEVCQPNIP